MRLVVSSGPAAGRVLEVESRLVVGRDEGCELVLEGDEKVSRRHCAFVPNPDGTVTVEDLGSSNGTFVGGVRVSAPVVLRGGEEVRVGSTVLRIEGERAAQATVVGAPATVAAASTAPGPPGAPPPGPPPAPPSGGGGPWWRSRWVVIGAVVVLVVVGGIVGGVLATTGGGDDEPVVVATTDGETSEPETVTVTEAVETEPPPETGDAETDIVETGVETDGTETGAERLSDVQQQLLTVVPAEIQPSCVGDDTPSSVSELSDGFVTGLHCTLPDELVVFYFQYDSNESMNTAYFSDLIVGDDPRDQGDCGEAFPAEGTYTTENGTETAGRVHCFMTGDPAHPVIWWTNDALGVLATTLWEGHSDRELYEFWATRSGPNP